jgi:hypothetical protein
MKQHLEVINTSLLENNDSPKASLPKLQVTFGIEELGALFCILQDSGSVIVDGKKNKEKALLILNYFQSINSLNKVEAFSKYLSPRPESLDKLEALLRKWQETIEATIKQKG